MGMTRSVVHTGMQSERPTKWQIFSASSMLVMKENEAKYSSLQEHVLRLLKTISRGSG